MHVTWYRYVTLVPVIPRIIRWEDDKSRSEKYVPATLYVYLIILSGIASVKPCMKFIIYGTLFFTLPGWHNLLRLLSTEEIITIM